MEAQTDRELMQEINRLRAQEPTTEDWRDLYETIEAYRSRCLGRAIAKSPYRDVLVAMIKRKAGVA